MGAAGGLLVLSRDADLLEVIGQVSTEHPVTPVSAETDLANRLLSDPLGVVVIDAAAAVTPIGELTEQLRIQFPDHVWIVAGDQKHQATLTADITKGRVYRFLHKPVSEQRIRLMLDAAWRRHEELLAGEAETPTTPSIEAGDRGPRGRAALFGVAATLLVAAGIWIVAHESTEPGQQAVSAAASTAAASADEAQLAALLSQSERALAGQHLEEAQKLVDRARALRPNDVRVTFLAARIGKEHERALLATARRATSSGNIRLAAAAVESGMSKDEVAALTVEAQRTPLTATATTTTTATATTAATTTAVASASSVPDQAAAEGPATAEATGADSTKAKAAEPSPLQLVHYVPPEFPTQANSRGISGWVDVQFVVRPDGSVGDAAVVGSEPAGVFEKAALNAVDQWRYNPPQRNGQPVEQNGRVRVRFTLQQ